MHECLLSIDEAVSEKLDKFVFSFVIFYKKSLYRQLIKFMFVAAKIRMSQIIVDHAEGKKVRKGSILVVSVEPINVNHDDSPKGLVCSMVIGPRTGQERLPLQLFLLVRE